MKIIENHLNELDRGLYNKSFSFAFPERAAVVRGAISRKINARFVRTPAAPVLSTDQGVRFSPSAQLFYEAHTRIANVPILSSSDLINSLRKAPLNRLDKLLDAYLLFFGNYKSIAQAILLRKDEILAEGSASACVQSGVILGALQDPRCMPFFERSEHLYAQAGDNFLAYAVAHRHATTYIKRFHDYDKGILIADTARYTYLNDDDLLTLSAQAMWHNLRGLAVLGQKDFSLALREMKMSIDLSELTLHKTADRSYHVQLTRHHNLIVINMAQLLLSQVKSHHEYASKAIHLLRNNAFFCAIQAPELFTESISQLAIAYYIVGDYQNALNAGLRALSGLKYLGFLTGIKLIRQIVVASLMRLGRETEAQSASIIYNNDQLGILLWFPPVMHSSQTDINRVIDLQKRYIKNKNNQ